MRGRDGSSKESPHTPPLLFLFNVPWFSLPSLQPGIAKVSLVLTPIIWPITASDANCIHVHWSSMITVKPYQWQCAMRVSLSKSLDWQNNGSVVCVIHSCTFHCYPLQKLSTVCLIAVKCMHVFHLNFKTSFVTTIFTTTRLFFSKHFWALCNTLPSIIPYMGSVFPPLRKEKKGLVTFHFLHESVDRTPIMIRFPVAYSIHSWISSSYTSGYCQIYARGE